MSAYSPDGSGNVHIDKVISGGSAKPVKKAAPRKVAKKAIKKAMRPARGGG